MSAPTGFLWIAGWRAWKLIVSEVFEPVRRQGRVADRGHDRSVAEIGLDGARVVAVVGELEAASMAQHVGMGAKGQEAAAPYFCKSKFTVDRCNGFRCSLTKNALPVGFIRARSFSHALTARSP